MGADVISFLSQRPALTVLFEFCAWIQKVGKYTKSDISLVFTPAENELFSLEAVSTQLTDE